MIARERGSADGRADVVGGRGLVEEEAGLVLRHEDRAQVADGRAFTGQLARRQARLCAPRAAAARSVRGTYSSTRNSGHAVRLRPLSRGRNHGNPETLTSLYEPGAGSRASRSESCARERMPSFAYVLRRWNSTVLTVTTSVCAISLLARPSAASRRRAARSASARPRPSAGARRPGRGRPARPRPSPASRAPRRRRPRSAACLARRPTS